MIIEVSILAVKKVLSVIAQQLLQLFSAKRELTSYNDAWRTGHGGLGLEKSWISRRYIKIYV